MAESRRASLGQVKEFFSDIAFILTLAWEEHKALVIGLGLVRALGAVIPSIQVYIGKLIVDQLVYLIQDRSQQALYDVLFFVGIEIGLLLLAQVLTSITVVLDDVLGEGFPFAILGRILKHTSTLDLSYFENPLWQAPPREVLGPRVRAGISTFAVLADPEEVEAGGRKLSRDIATGRIDDVIAGYHHTQGDYLFVRGGKQGL
jgi:hypothetical protein